MASETASSKRASVTSVRVLKDFSPRGPPEGLLLTYCSKDGKQEKVFDALEWLAAMGSHLPNKAEQMFRYYGYYSNVSRRKGAS